MGPMRLLDGGAVNNTILPDDLAFQAATFGLERHLPFSALGGANWPGMPSCRSRYAAEPPCSEGLTRGFGIGGIFRWIGDVGRYVTTP